MHLLDYIDNSIYTLESIPKQLIEDENQHILDIATGFFRIEAWLLRGAAMNRLTSFHLLIGATPPLGQQNQVALI
jgi:hypothetical protein